MWRARAIVRWLQAEYRQGEALLLFCRARCLCRFMPWCCRCFSWLFGVLCVAALFLAASYPFTKRFLAIPQAYLGVAFGFGIPMAYAAQLGSVPLEAWWLLLANVFWAIAYDTEYAMVDRADDLKLGIRTSAITFGSRRCGSGDVVLRAGALG
jgi:4-hydroxybenzoate polyprenyltransferase